jgi:hypothetical protein
LGLELGLEFGFASARQPKFGMAIGQDGPNA